MRIEFLAEGSRDCPLIRLYDWHPEAQDMLRRAALNLADGRITEFRLHDQPWAKPVDGCQFLWRIDRKNVGVRLPDSGRQFVLRYSDEAWREVADKIAATGGGFNWLTNEGDVAVLLSWDGHW